MVGYRVRPSPPAGLQTVCARSRGGHGGASAEAQQDLLAVLQGAPVAHALQGALGLGQQAHPVPRWGEQRHGEVAAGQQDGMGALPLAGNALALCKKGRREEMQHCDVQVSHILMTDRYHHNGYG